jgi:hypothetical protein
MNDGKLRVSFRFKLADAAFEADDDGEELADERLARERCDRHRGGFV